MNSYSKLSTESRGAFVFDAVKQALNNEQKHGTYDDPEFIEAVADHAAYCSMKVDGIDEFEVRDARIEINELVGRGKLRLVTHDFWTEDKVTLP